MSGVLSSGVSKPGTGDIEGVTAGVGISGGGTSGTVTVTLDLSELSAVTPANGDSLSTIDSDGANEQLTTVAALATLFAGVGLSASSAVLTLDLSELSAVTPANGDSLATIDSDGGTEQLTTIAALATLLAGAGLTASNSVIGADASSASAKGIVIVAGGDGVAVSYSSGTATSAVDLGTNSGLEISSNKLQIAKGISQHDVAQFTTSVVDDDFLRVAGTVVEGRSASEVLSDISAAPAAGSANVVTTGALDSGSISSNFGAINNGASNITTTGTVAAGIVDITADAHLDSSPSDESVSGITATFTAGEDLVRGEVVYFKAGDSKMWKAVASASGTMPVVAMAAADISADATGKFLLYGFCGDNGTFPAYTVGAKVFAPEAETGSQNVPEEAAPDSDGDFVQVVGFAVTANSLFFNPSNDVIEHA